MIVFISGNFHTGVRSYERQSGAYLPRLLLFVYIVEKNYVSITDEVSKIPNTNKCDVNGPTCVIGSNNNVLTQSFFHIMSCFH